MIELKVISKDDPLNRKPEKQKEKEEFSPMDPPDAYAPPNMETVPYEQMHPFLRTLVDEHKVCISNLDAFEKTLLEIQENGISRDVNEKLKTFFEFFDTSIVAHNQKEEKVLFPLLQKRLLENGEHGQGAEPVTAVNMLEDDHVNALQLAAVVFNFFGLALRLPDPDSRIVVLDAAIQQGKVLIELLRLHIFREDNVSFTQAHTYITTEEFDEMAKLEQANDMPVPG